MARRKKDALNDLVEVAASLPWWAGVLMAAVAFAVLHHYAAVPSSAPPPEPANIGRTLLGVFCLYLQYIVPAALLIGAAISGWRRRRAKTLWHAALQLPEGAGLASFHWEEFERLVGQAFREQGYSVVDRGGHGPDGGVDLVLRRDGKTYLVQCKHWKSQAVGVTPVRELMGLVAAHRAAGGILVASGDYTPDARSFAAGLPIQLLRAEALLGRAMPESAQSTEPVCPKCGAAMTLRIARRGAAAGNRFWGCTAYPKCRGIRAIEARAG